MKPDRSSPSAVENCSAVRLASSELVAVDRCSCGTLRVHLGALTLRITPEGLHAVMQTLAEALIADARVHKVPQLSAALGSTKITRGQS